MRDADPIALLLAGITWVIFWFWIISKVGYKGQGRFIFLFLLCIPGVNAFALLALLILPFPIQKELKELRKQAALQNTDRRY